MEIKRDRRETEERWKRNRREMEEIKERHK